MFKSNFIFFGNTKIKPVVFIFQFEKKFEIFVITNFFLNNCEEFLLYQKETDKLEDIIPYIYHCLKQTCNICNNGFTLDKWSFRTAGLLYKQDPATLLSTQEFENYITSSKFNLKKDITSFDEIKNRLEVPIVCHPVTFELIKSSINPLYINTNESFFIHHYQYFQNTIVTEFSYINFNVFNNFSYRKKDLIDIFSHFQNYEKLFYRQDYYIILNNELKAVYAEFKNINKKYSFEECLIIIYFYIIRNIFILDRIKSNLTNIQKQFNYQDYDDNDDNDDDL